MIPDLESNVVDLVSIPKVKIQPLGEPTVASSVEVSQGLRFCVVTFYMQGLFFFKFFVASWVRRYSRYLKFSPVVGVLC